MSAELESVTSSCPDNITDIHDSTSTLALTSLPDGILIRIIQAADPAARRQLRLATRTLRPLVDACSTSLTLSSYSLPCLLSRGRLPDFAPELSCVLLSLQDITAPAGFLAKLPCLSIAQLPRLTSLTLALANDHLLSPAAVADIAAAIPPSTTRLVLTHMLGAGRPAVQLSARPSPAAAAAAGQPQLLDYATLRHLLHLCPQIREVRLKGGCWVRNDFDLQALVNLTRPSKAPAPVRMADISLSGGVGTSGGPAAADDGDREVVISSIRGLYLDTADEHMSLPCALEKLRGLAALDVHIAARGARQEPPPRGAGALMAHAVAAANGDAASVGLLWGLVTPALTGLTRLVVREFQGNTMALIGALEGLPLLAHLGLSGLDDAPYITDTHLQELSRLRSLKHLAVDRLDISQHGDQRRQQPSGGLFAAAEPYLLGAGGGSGGASGGILPHLTGLEVALVVHSVQRLPHAFPSVQHLTLRWLWEQAMRKLAGWTSLTCLSLANLDCCLDWGLLRTLTGLTQLQLCRGSSYEQLAELLYLLRALPGLQVLHLNGWHCMRSSEPDKMALGPTRGRGNAGLGVRMSNSMGGGLGTGFATAAVEVQEVRDDGGRGSGGRRAVVGADGGCSTADLSVGSGDAAGVQMGRGSGYSSHGYAAQQLQDPEQETKESGNPLKLAQPRPVQDAVEEEDAAGSRTSRAFAPPASTFSSSPSSFRSPNSAVAAAFAALDPDLHHACALIRAAPDATTAAGAAMTLLHALPRLCSLELTDCGNPLLRCLASRVVLEDGGPLVRLRELRLCRLLDVVGADVEEAAAALPGLRRLEVHGCWPVDGEVLLQLEGLRRSGVDVVWRR